MRKTGWEPGSCVRPEIGYQCSAGDCVAVSSWGWNSIRNSYLDCFC